MELWISQPSTLKEFRKRQFFPALRLADACGLGMVALGASTPYACNYGRLPRPLDTPSITTGHAATAAMLKQWAIHASEANGLDFGAIKLAIFGAAGRLGKAVSRFIGYAETPSELILIDLPDKLSLLQALAAEIVANGPRQGPKVSVFGVDGKRALPAFDGAVLVSSNTVPYLGASDLRRARFWIDDSHPRAASLEAEEATRADTLYIECYARGPKGLNTEFPFRLPTPGDCYTCFAEGYLAWKENVPGDFVTGIPDTATIARVSDLLEEHGFTFGPFCGKSGALI
ncbi:hypothetical protein [Candidatus Thiosymbion oneisti]|uniref:hypothetical protein n=1 Tax=Candidatus Thiosymbion oneisti TaxID=589554 RepID=UPI000B7CBBFB|nr:hypothetical protein [Candidatus Thiosymbion oneisti]